MFIFVDEWRKGENVQTIVKEEYKIYWTSFSQVKKDELDWMRYEGF